MVVSIAGLMPTTHRCRNLNLNPEHAQPPGIPFLEDADGVASDAGDVFGALFPGSLSVVDDDESSSRLVAERGSESLHAL